MNDELVEPRLEDLMIGSVIPMDRNKILDGWLAFNGQTFYEKDYPELFEVISGMNDDAGEIFDGWGAEIDYENRSVTLPDIDSDTVISMMWGVELRNAPKLALAMKAVRSEV